MRLFERDYRLLLPEEERAWQLIQQEEVVGTLGEFKITKSRFRDYPKAARHFLHLFPNNYLDIVELQDSERLSQLVDEFEILLDSKGVTERDISSFISMKGAFFIIGALLKERFTFGHHEAYLFPEFQIGNSYKADHLLVGRNSDGYHFVFVELEAPSGRITRADGSLGDAFRRGLSQIADWEDWLDARYSSLMETFEKAKQRNMPLPSEFFQLDRSRIHFIVIAGRRTDFNEKTYRISRKQPHKLLHYDNLLDDAREVIGKQTY